MKLVHASILYPMIVNNTIGWSFTVASEFINRLIIIPEIDIDFHLYASLENLVDFDIGNFPLERHK